MAMDKRAFARRLGEACILRNIGGTMARAVLLMSITGCSRRTALRWITGQATPYHGNHIVRIAAALDVDASWLAGVANQSPMLAALVRKFSSLTPEMQLEAVCLIDRLALDV